ncbi:MAG: hypothetical protein RL701_3465 [Pseudomonadota bacterium]|jgi:uncharacterized protein YdiU (UPF0061 family)
MSSPASPVTALSFRNRLVETLPGDPLTDTRSRQVAHACYSRVEPTPVAAPELLIVVPEVAALLELTSEVTPELTAILSGNQVLPEMKPYAACYGGHQFGNWAGQLGDGRAITLTEVATSSGASYEVQLKGAGRTPYSRTADGRAVLRSSLRELVCSEAMFHLGVPTTRALSLALTGDKVMRDLLYDGHAAFEPGAIVARVAPSFLRFGNFELHSARKDTATLSKLVQFSIERYFPQFSVNGRLDLAGWYEEICQRTARLMVEWMRVGFVHGVMNTDNMSLLGLTIDYGPYGWLDVYDPEWTPNTTDAGGRRYRFGHQPYIGQWNLMQLARALAPLFDDVSPLETSLNAYAEYYADQEQRMWRNKLGLSTEQVDDPALFSELIPALVAVETDMSLFFRKLAELPTQPSATSPDQRLALLSDAFYALETIPASAFATLQAWLERYAQRIGSEDASVAQRRARMHAVNPLYVPRNYLVQEVIEKTQAGDRAALPELLDVLRHPYTEQPGREAFAAKRPDWARNKPGCSMLSCSS